MKIVIGFITYNDTTAKYLPFFVPSLKAALDFSVLDYRILAVDNSDTELNENSVYLKNNWPEIKLTRAGVNLGFAQAYNLMIGQAREMGAEYFLMLNPDTVLTPDSVMKLIATLDSDQSLGAVAPRILKWDFEHNIQTSIIDSDGLFLTSSQRFSDRHQGRELFSSLPEIVFGFTGAAALLRMKALSDVVYNGKEYLDELMFMYKEDVDLSYRLTLANWPIKFIPSAIIYHDRTASPLGEGLGQIIRNRKNKSRLVKRWSFLNHWILILKYSHLKYSCKVKWRTWRYQFLSLFFALLFEPYLGKELITLRRIRREIRAKRQALKIIVNPKIIEKMMDKQG